MDNFSKPIVKTDEDAKKLIIEALEGKVTGGFDIDSIYKINDIYYILEFLKCETVRPFCSHPNRYWFKNQRKFISLWDITQSLKGMLYLINYEESREQFKVIKILKMDKSGITKETIKLWDFIEFKKWFQQLNLHKL